MPGYKLIGNVCVEVDGCLANKAQVNSTSPCYPSVDCIDVPAEADPGGKMYKCANWCPVGFQGDGETCTQCPIQIVVSGASFAGASGEGGGALTLARGTDATLYGAMAALPAACNATGGFSFWWEGTLGGQPVPLSQANRAYTLALTLPARSLAAGQQASFVLVACFAAGPPALCAVSRPFAFAVVPSPLVPNIAPGGNVVVGSDAAVTLDGSGSRDPNAAPSGQLSGLRFAWACQGPGPGGQCLQPNGSAVVLRQGQSSQVCTRCL